MTLKQELIVGAAMVAVAWILYAGMVGYLENLDDKLVEAGIDILEIVR